MPSTAHLCANALTGYGTQRDRRRLRATLTSRSAARTPAGQPPAIREMILWLRSRRICARCPPPPSSPPALRARERRREPPDRAGDPALPGARGAAARGPDRHRAGAGDGVRRLAADASRGPAAARLLAPDPRRPRPRRRHLRRPHAQRGHEPQRQRVDLDDARHRERLARRSCSTRACSSRSRWPGSPRPTQARTTAAGPAGRDRRGRRPRTGHAAVQRGRQALSPDPRQGGGQRTAARVHRLDPRGAAAELIANISATRRRRRDPAPARDIQRAVKRRQSAAAEKAMRAHITYLRDIHRLAHARAPPAQVPLLDLPHDRRGTSVHRHAGGASPARTRRRAARWRHPLLPVVAEHVLEHPGQAGAAGPRRGAAGVQRDVAAIPAGMKSSAARGSARAARHG